MRLNSYNRTNTPVNHHEQTCEATSDGVKCGAKADTLVAFFRVFPACYSCAKSWEGIARFYELRK